MDKLVLAVVELSIMLFASHAMKRAHPTLSGFGTLKEEVEPDKIHVKYTDWVCLKFSAS